MRTLGEILPGVVAELRRRHPDERWPVVRGGERAEIPWLVRLSVYRRDDFACKLCGYFDAKANGLQLDHCLPWSAGGADSTDNLRVLCEPCNMHRGNRRDHAHKSAYRPTTWWCVRCWTAERSKPRPLWVDGTDLSRAPLVRGGDAQTYCAWCGGMSASDVVLAGPLLPRLIDLCAPNIPRPAKDRREVVPGRPGRDVRPSETDQQEDE